MNLEIACKVLKLKKSLFSLTSSKDIRQKELKSAYRKMALKHHPDIGGKEKDFKKVTSAHKFLMNYIPTKVTKSRPTKPTKPTKKEEKKAYSTKSNTKTKIKNAFGVIRKKRRKKPLDPQDIIIPIEVSVKELYEGFNQKLEYTRRKACSNCYSAGCYLCDGQLSHEKLQVEIYIHSSLMNSENEIIYKDLGEITYEKADLIIPLNIVKSKFSLEYRKGNKYPIVVSTEILNKGQTEIILNTLNEKIKITIPKNHKGTLNLKNKGLIFNTNKGEIRGDHHIILKYN
jgi:DnaJ-class molecular chaperone